MESIRAALGDLEKLTDADLLGRLNAVTGELRRRGLSRSGNNPISDYAELLSARALGLTVAPRSTTGYDAVGPDGKKYEVKARRQTKLSKVTRWGAIRGLDKRHFDFLVVVLFGEDFKVTRALLIPHETVAALAAYNKHQNAWILLNGSKLQESEVVRDITAKLRAQQ